MTADDPAEVADEVVHEEDDDTALGPLTYMNQLMGEDGVVSRAIIVEPQQDQAAQRQPDRPRRKQRSADDPNPAGQRSGKDVIGQQLWSLEQPGHGVMVPAPAGAIPGRVVESR